MPAPTFTNTQTIPTCANGGGLAIDETDLDRGTVEIHSSCCRTFADRIRISGPAGSILGVTRDLIIEGTTVDICSKTGTGAKVYSSDEFKICGTPAVTGSHTGNGTASGGTISGTGTGTTSAGGSYAITVEGEFTNPLNGSGNGTVSGDLSGTFTFTTTAGVTTTTFLFDDGSTGTGTGSYTFGGGGTTFTFAGTITKAASSINAYLKATWTHCSRRGVKLELLKSSDHSLLAEYGNKFHAVKNGMKTILFRKSLACDHPCRAQQGQASFVANNPLALCFTAITGMRQCLGGKRPKEISLIFGAAPDPITGPLDGATVVIPTSSSSGVVSVVSSFTPSGTISIDGCTVEAPTFTATNITVELNIVTAIDAGFSGTFEPCFGVGQAATTVQAGNIDATYSKTGLVGSTANFVGSLPGGFVTPFTVNSISMSMGVTYWGDRTSDYCDGNVVLTPRTAQVLVINLTSGATSYTITAPFASDVDFEKTAELFPSAVFSATDTEYRP